MTGCKWYHTRTMHDHTHTQVFPTRKQAIRPAALFSLRSIWLLTAALWYLCVENYLEKSLKEEVRCRSRSTHWTQRCTNRRMWSSNTKTSSSIWRIHKRSKSAPAAKQWQNSWESNAATLVINPKVETKKWKRNLICLTKLSKKMRFIQTNFQKRDRSDHMVGCRMLSLTKMKVSYNLLNGILCLWGDTYLKLRFVLVPLHPLLLDFNIYFHSFEPPLRS